MSTEEMPWGNRVVEKLKALMEAQIEATTKDTPLSLPDNVRLVVSNAGGARPGIRQARRAQRGIVFRDVHAHPYDPAFGDQRFPR